MHVHTLVYTRMTWEWIFTPFPSLSNKNTFLSQSHDRIKQKFRSRPNPGRMTHNAMILMFSKPSKWQRLLFAPFGQCIDLRLDHLCDPRL